MESQTLSTICHESSTIQEMLSCKAKEKRPQTFSFSQQFWVHILWRSFQWDFLKCCSLFCTFWLFRNYYSSDAPHVNYGEHSLNHHFRHSAHSVYKIYSVFKLFEFAVASAHFEFFEITTPVMRIMLTMANIV